jgi:4-amino-4-deoxy-L-arabinose transferase-like glycosyltransferase
MDDSGTMTLRDYAALAAQRLRDRWARTDQKAAVALAAVLVTYVVLSVYLIWEPGIQNDEVLGVGISLGRDYGEWGWTLFGYHLPVMLSPYIGTPKELLMRLVYWFTPVDAVTMRLPGVVAGAGTIALTFVLARAVFGLRIAVFAALLLGTDPLYIFAMRHDYGPQTLAMLSKAGALLLFYQYWRTRRPAYVFFGGVLLGLGVWHKANFGWFLIALPFALFGAYGLATIRALNRRVLAAVLGGLVVGAFPFLTYNLLSGRNSFTEFDQLVQRSSLTSLIALKMGTLVPLSLNGEYFYSLFSSGQRLGSHTIVYVLAIASFLLIALMAIRDRRVSAGVRFLAITTLIILAFIIWTPRATAPWHVVFLYPFLPVLIAAVWLQFGERLQSWLPKRPWVSRLAHFGIIAVLVGAVYANVKTDAAYFQYLAAEGGAGAWSDAIYSLASYLDHETSGNVAVMDWGFKAPITGLTRNHVEGFELFWALLGPDQEKSANALEPYLPKYSLFLFHAPDFTQFQQPRAVLDLVAKRHALQAVTLRRFSQRNGQPIYELVTLRPLRHAFAPNGSPPRP